MAATSPVPSLVDAGARIVVAGARQYLRAHNLSANPDALAECCRSWLKAQLPVALHDAKEALDCGMADAAEATFKATLTLAGTEAAKECAIAA